MAVLTKLGKNKQVIWVGDSSAFWLQMISQGAVMQMC